MGPLLADALPVLADVLSFGSVGIVARAGIVLGLLLLGGFFAAAEGALFSLTSGDREAMAETPDGAARRVLALLDRPRRLVLTLLLLRTTVCVAAALVGASLAHAAGAAFEWDVLTTLLGVGVILAFTLLVVGELAPKLLTMRRPGPFARAAAAPLSALVALATPIVRPLEALTGRLARRRPAPAPLSPEDLKTMADTGQAQGTLEEEEAALIHAVVEFGETTVREVMVSRVDMVALPESATLSDALTLIRESGHSRFPLYRDDLDHITGVVYAKDLLPYLGPDHAPDERPDWAFLARKPRFVPVTKKLDDLLEDFQATNTHIALVVDEYGGTAGLVTLEDLLEEVVGDIRDELDSADDEALVRPAGPSTWRADARVDLDDLADALALELDTDAFDFETLGGLIFHLRGEVPRPGDEVRYERLRLRVETVEQNRIREVLVEVVPTEAAART